MLLSDSVSHVLACPNCLKSLKLSEQGAFCPICNIQYPYTKKGQLDLRLKTKKNVLLQFNLTPSFTANKAVFHFLPFNLGSKGNFEVDGITNELSSYIPEARSNHSLMLDLGCGDERYKPIFIKAGFDYVGIDYSSESAGLLGDAHALPFLDGSFEFVFSRAVIEHLQYPPIATREVFRVLKSKSKFVGTAAFQEPFHKISFCHYSHFGLLNCFQQAGFKVDHISPNPKWDMLAAHASMSLFPRMPSGLSKVFVAPLRNLHIMWWKIGRHFNPEADELKRLLMTTGSFMFIVQKPE